MSDLAESTDGKNFELLLAIDMGVDAFASNWASCDRLSSYISRMVSHNRMDSLLYSNLFSSALNELLETVFRRHRPGGNFTCSVSRRQRRDRIELTIPCDAGDKHFYQAAIERLSRPDAADHYRSALFADGPIDPDVGLFELVLDYNAVLSVDASDDGSIRLVADLALEDFAGLMADTAQSTFDVRFDENNQEFSIIGSMRPQKAEDLDGCATLFAHALKRVRGTLYVNVKRLVRLNNIAFRVLAGLMVRACGERPDLRISVITSSVVGWSTRKFGALPNANPNIFVEEYDSEFYPGQSFLEEGEFIPILRTQTKMTWRHEREILPRHGMKPGLAIADICCGIGDFAVLAFKEFRPARIVALDHSRSSLAYARRVASDFGIQGIEYIYGDASEMLLEDSQFDFVTCRHALQVFDRPELILKELYRICKPGGRVYISNEKNSHCLGEPRADSIQWTYNEVAALWSHFKMDIELGPKSRRFLFDNGFEDIRMESFMVTNLDGDPQDFADIIQSWENVYAGQMAVQRGDSPEFLARFRKGFQDHIFAALHPKGYAGWPVWVASGRKPL